MKKIYFLSLIILVFCNCKPQKYIDLHPIDDSYWQDVSLQKSFYTLDTLVIAEKIPDKLILDRVFFLSNETKRVEGKVELSFMVLPHNKVEKIIKSFNSSFLSSTQQVEKADNFNLNNLLWTDKNLNHLYGNLRFDPKIVKLEDLVAFSRVKDDEINFLPLVCLDHIHSIFLDSEYRYTTHLTVAFYIFDKNQIYYARSANLSKKAYMENSINPKDTEFQQSEWDYLVYEALRPLIEKGVELEIVGREN